MRARRPRGRLNRAIREIEASGAIAPFPVQNWLTGRFRAEAGRQGRGDLQSLWMGQAAPLAVRDDVRAVFEELAAGVSATGDG
jgi:nitronate monooxygenase